MSDVKEKVATLTAYQKLSKVRVSIQSLVAQKKIKKSGKNTNRNFSYYELSDFMPYATQLFDEVGLLDAFNLLKDKAVITVYNTENPSETILFESTVVDATVNGVSAIQSLGSSHTYMKRYLYYNVLDLSDNDELDPLVGTDKLVIKPSTIDQISKIKSAYTSEEIASMLKRLKKENIEDVTFEDAEKMIKARAGKRESVNKPAEQKEPVVEKKVSSLDSIK